MKVFAISGLGADKRIFQFLSLNYQIVFIDWLTPNFEENIEDYCQRLAIKYDLLKEKNFTLLGVSFGGLIAVELTKLTNPTCTILVSSVETKNEISWLVRLIGKLKLLTYTPKKLLIPPKDFAYYLFGTRKKQLLNSILEDTDRDFLKWALIQLTTWQNNTPIEPLLKLNGNKDLLFSAKGKSKVIEGGKHFMIADKANQISRNINSFIKAQATL